MAVFLLILVPSKQNFVFEQESHRTQATRAEAHTIGGGDLIDFFAPGRVMLNLLWVGAGRCLLCWTHHPSSAKVGESPLPAL